MVAEQAFVFARLLDMPIALLRVTRGVPIQHNAIDAVNDVFLQIFRWIGQPVVAFSLRINGAMQIAVKQLVVAAPLNQRTDRRTASMRTVSNDRAEIVFGRMKLKFM